MGENGVHIINRCHHAGGKGTERRHNWQRYLKLEVKKQDLLQKQKQTQNRNSLKYELYCLIYIDIMNLHSSTQTNVGTLLYVLLC